MKNLFLFTFLIFFAFSCSSDIEDTSSDNENIARTVNFIYKGKSYASGCKEVGSELVFTNEEVGKLYLELKALPELIEFVHENGDIEYFDNDTHLDASMKVDIDQTKDTKSAYLIQGHIVLREHTLADVNKGTEYRYSFQSTASVGWFDVLKIQDFRYMPRSTTSSVANFNDKLTGIYAQKSAKGTLRVRIYQHINYKGKSRIFDTNGAVISVNNLKSYNMSGTLFWKENWNDEVSSIIVSLWHSQY